MTKRAPGRPPLVEGEVTTSRGIRLGPSDWAVVDQAATDAGMEGVSAGVRAIVAEWRRMRQIDGGTFWICPCCQKVAAPTGSLCIYCEEEAQEEDRPDFDDPAHLPFGA